MTENKGSLRPGVEFEISHEEFLAKASEREILAYEVAKEIHKDDIRSTTGEPYLNHCVAVAEFLRIWGGDEDLIVAGLLHDTWEDHPKDISIEQIREMFGERVAQLVDGVSKFKSPTGKDNDFETLRKVTKETMVEPGVAMVKLADRLHNMSTMEGFKEEKKLAKARETLRVYVPMAESLGLWQVKNALADISFSYIEPERYQYVKRMIDEDPRLNMEFIENTKKEILAVIEEAGIKATVEHQVGGYWELSEKQKNSAMRSDSKPKEFVDITDVVSIRVLIEDENDLDACYVAMGRVRAKYGELLRKDRSDDYLVVPALNGYSALHDTYKMEQGNVEIAFTTKKREEFNNWGVASISQEELKENPEKYKIKMVFTPKEELVFLDPKATGIDAAYKLKPLLGLRAVAIEINGEVMGLDTVVPNAAMVTIITEQHQIRPRVEWLKFCNKETAMVIERQLNVASHDEEVIKGEKMLVEGLLKDRGILSIEDLDRDIVDKLLVEMGCWYGIKDLYYKVASGLNLETVNRKLDELGIGRGMFTSVLVEGDNAIGISEEVARIISRNGGDGRSKREKVGKDERFSIRVLLTVGYHGKKRIEEELKARFPDCLVV